MPWERVQIEITPPRVFKAGTGAVFAALLVPAIVVLGAALVVSVLPLGFHSLPIVVAIGLVVLLVLRGLGNARVASLVSSIAEPGTKQENGFVVQLTLTPRIRSGLRAIVEDADDIGYLNMNGEELVYRGDAVKLTVPFTQIKEIHYQNVGFRGLFVYGGRMVVAISGLPNVTELVFAERSSLWLMTSRKVTRQLRQRLEAVKLA